MEPLSKFVAFILMWLTWHAIGGACQSAPAPAPIAPIAPVAPAPALMAPAPGPMAPAPPPSPPHYYEPFEEDAVYDMLTTWNKTGTNASALMASWPNNFTHPCLTSLVRQWYLCSQDLVQIGNLTGFDHKLYNMNLLYGRNQTGDVELVGGLPEAITQLTNLKYVRIDGHPRLSGPLPINMIKSFPAMTSLSLTNNKLNGTITAPPTPFFHIDELDLSGNAFTGTPFCQDKASNFTVRNLNFSSNQFSGIYCGDDSSSELELLDVSFNRFTDINISILGESDNIFPLKIIYAQNNSLEHFPDNLLYLPQLEEIYLDNNNLLGDLAFPDVSITTSSLRVVSILHNNITSLTPSKKSPSLFDASSLQISDLVFLGGNPICMDSRKSDLLLMVCRFNKSSPLEDPYSGSSKKVEIISACLGGVAFVALLVALFLFRKLMKKIAIIRKFQDELDKKDVKPNLYSYTELKNATQDFHPTNVLGKGGFGVVFKGILLDKNKVAVKRLHQAQENFNVQGFLNEIIVISKIKHRNLVQLKGCCIKGDQQILVYELVDGKNLADLLWGESSEDHLDWGSRFNIILGIARGLAYLHEEIDPPIIHRDIKGPNILLDKEFNPKIADFGLALLLPTLDDGQTHVNISRIAGTMGYLAPEYATTGQLSTKVDVYSFGILILEIVSGRKNIDTNMPPEQMCLSLWAQRLHAKHETIKLVDKSLQDLTTAENATIKRVVEIGLLCLHHVATRRPNISDIIAMLIGNKEIDHDALYTYHQTYTPQEEAITSSSIPSLGSWSLSHG